MKRFSSLGTFLAATAMLGLTAPRRARTATDRFAAQTNEQYRATVDRAVAKRQRKAARLREHGL